MQFFKKAAAAPAKKAAAAAPAKKGTKPTTVVKKATGAKVTKGWFGGSGGPDNLDKWYGERASLSADGTLDAGSGRDGALRQRHPAALAWRHRGAARCRCWQQEARGGSRGRTAPAWGCPVTQAGDLLQCSLSAGSSSSSSVIAPCTGPP
jgi:hypothetical protein